MTITTARVAGVGHITAASPPRAGTGIPDAIVYAMDLCGADRILIREARALRAMLLRHPPGHIQRTAAYFLSLGHYDSQVTRMARAYRRRRAEMEAALTAHGLMGGAGAAGGGSSFWLQAPPGIDTTALARDLLADGVVIEPGGVFFADRQAGQRFYRLSYSSIDSGRIAEGIARIARRMAQSGPMRA